MSRQQIWEQIRKQHAKNGRFTIKSLRARLDKSIGHSTVRVYVSSLIKAGHLQRNPRARDQIELVVDTGVEAPRVHPNGAKVQPGSVQENLWRAMRIMRRFTPHDLALAAATGERSCSEYSARRYCSILAHAGYLLRDKPFYQTIPSRYTGPLPPVIKRGPKVYDQNTNKVVWEKHHD